MTRRGFTLVELMVTMAIVAMVIVSGVTLAVGNVQRSKLATTGDEVQQALRRARNNAKSSVIDCSVCTCTPSQTPTLNGWEVAFGAGSYTVRGVCGVTPTQFMVKAVSLPTGITFSPVPPAIVFSPVVGGTNIVGTQAITLVGYGSTVGMSVTTSGQVSAGPTATPMANTPTPTPTAGASVAILTPPEADTRVNDSLPTTAYGSEVVLRVVFDAAGETAISYVKFNIATISGTVTNARLRMYVSDVSANTQTVKSVNSVNWNENMTWNTGQPALGSGIATIPATTATGWIESDVTTWVAQRVGAGATKISFGIDAAVGSDALEFSAREGANPAELVITYN